MTQVRQSAARKATQDIRAAAPQELPEFKTEMPYQTLLLARLLQADYLVRIAETGVAPAQSFVLAELWENEPLSQVELARRLDIGKATVGQTLNRLERGGLIERQRHATDGRVTMIHLTDKGRAMRDPLDQAAIAQRAMLRTLLGEDMFEQLRDLMMQATQRLSALGLGDKDASGD